MYVRTYVHVYIFLNEFVYSIYIHTYTISVPVQQNDVRIRMAEAKFSEEKAKMQQKLEQTIRKVCLQLPLSYRKRGRTILLPNSIPFISSWIKRTMSWKTSNQPTTWKFTSWNQRQRHWRDRVSWVVLRYE